MARIRILVRDADDGWLADVTVHDGGVSTRHRVRVTRDEHERYGGGDVADLVRRSFEFLLAHESSTAIMREFSLATIERYFADYAAEVARR